MLPMEVSWVTAASPSLKPRGSGTVEPDQTQLLVHGRSLPGWPTIRGIVHPLMLPMEVSWVTAASPSLKTRGSGNGVPIQEQQGIQKAQPSRRTPCRPADSRGGGAHNGAAQ